MAHVKAKGKGMGAEPELRPAQSARAGSSRSFFTSMKRWRFSNNNVKILMGGCQNFGPFFGPLL